jgi:6-phosphogluconolactonase (cycloisomerase 2 family)
MRAGAVLAAAMLGCGGVESAARERSTDLLYVQSGDGLKWFSVDGRNGAVVPKGELPTPKQPHYYLRVSPDRKVLYSAGERLLSFWIGADGGLARAAEAPSPGGPCYVDVHPSGRWVATANYGSGTTLVHPAGVAGALREAESFPSGPQSHSTRFHPGGRFLYTLSVAGRQITRFAFDEATGKAVPWTLAMPDLGPRHIAFSPRGDLAFVVHERPIRVSSLRVDPETGKLEPLGDWPALAPGVSERKELAAAEIAVAPSGRFVIASVRDFSKEAGLNGLAVFAVDPGSGALRWVEFVSSGGVSPRGFVIDPSGAFLYVLNEIPGTLRVFRMDPDSGRLQPAGEPLPVGGRAIGIALLRLAS